MCPIVGAIDCNPPQGVMLLDETAAVADWKLRV